MGTLTINLGKSRAKNLFQQKIFPKQQNTQKSVKKFENTKTKNSINYDNVNEPSLATDNLSQTIAQAIKIAFVVAIAADVAVVDVAS